MVVVVPPYLSRAYSSRWKGRAKRNRNRSRKLINKEIQKMKEAIEISYRSVAMAVPLLLLWRLDVNKSGQ